MGHRHTLSTLSMLLVTKCKLLRLDRRSMAASRYVLPSKSAILPDTDAQSMGKCANDSFRADKIEY